jgi:lipoprotein-releasing system permease protein
MLGLLGAAVLATLIAAVQVFRGPKLVSILMWRYLRKRRIAWVSLVAVTMCTAMVLVVISVMGGWLRMFRETNHGLIGDIVVYRESLNGFGHYDEMIKQIKTLPEVKAAAPVIDTYALINIDNQIKTGVQVEGIDLDQIAKVNKFVDGLHLQPKDLLAQADALQKAGNTADADAMRAKAKNFPSFDKVYSDDDYRSRMPNSKVDVADGNTMPGMIIGSSVVSFPKNKEGVAERPNFLYTTWVRLTPLVSSDDVSPDNSATSGVRTYWIVDDAKTGVFQVDEKTVYVPFDVLQKDLKMDPQEAIDRITGKTIMTPARTNSIEISLKDGYDMNLVRPKIEKIVNDIAAQYGMVYPIDPITTETWEQKQADFLNAVEHEKVLLVFLFAIISVVAVFLVFCIFYMIVVEKTRDIGIIKSVGATSGVVTQIFLGYGLIIGLIGGGMGLLLGYLVIHNINWLHHELGVIMGIQIWDAKTYLFDTIPNTMQMNDVVVIVTIAVLAAVAGAVVPAFRAGRMNPIEALRFE